MNDNEIPTLFSNRNNGDIDKVVNMDKVPLKSVLQFISQLKAFNYIPEFMNYVSIESWNDTDKWIMVPSENTSCDRGGPLQLKIAQYSWEVFWTYLLTQYPFSLKISRWFLDARSIFLLYKWWISMLIIEACVL